ncbi:MAG: imidazole glycerol phosphate synthase subunit HisH [Syntrophobacteraceae bacterium]|nr:imidazole glycerol phosphate synthase subunit HisH [Syntrophobacteraceae bacterium]
MIAILDYRAGNLTSVERALKHLGFPCEVTDSHRKIQQAERIIFPGVGAAGKSMENLKNLGLDTLLRERLQAGIPIMGICVGLQVLFDYSEENNSTPCLGILPGAVHRFPEDLRSREGSLLKIPHMGWNEVRFVTAHPVFDGVPEGSAFYFVHSYYPRPAAEALVAGITDYGMEFCAAVARDNLVAMQFHPEKSGPPGLGILSRFCRWDGTAPRAD